jgi:hypothetical protein
MRQGPRRAYAMLALLVCGYSYVLDAVGDAQGAVPATRTPPPATPLRLRGGKRGRNSVVVGKTAHQKKMEKWTHFTGGEAFGVDVALSSTGRWNLKPSGEGHGLPPRAGGILSRAKLQTGGREAKLPRLPRTHALQPAGPLYTRACESIRRLGVNSVCELGCSDGQLLERALARSANANTHTHTHPLPPSLTHSLIHTLSFFLSFSLSQTHPDTYSTRAHTGPLRRVSLCVPIGILQLVVVCGDRRTTACDVT